MARRVIFLCGDGELGGLVDVVDVSVVDAVGEFAEEVY